MTNLTGNLMNHPKILMLRMFVLQLSKQKYHHSHIISREQKLTLMYLLKKNKTFSQIQINQKNQIYKVGLINSLI